MLSRRRARRPSDTLLAAAIKLQRAYREVRLTWVRYGPSIFVTHNGLSSPYGRFRFARNVTSSPARWMCVAETSKVTLLCNFLDRYWQIAPERLDMVLDVAGSLRGLDLPPRLTAALTDGLDAAIRTTRCCLFTGGFDAGVAQLVGTAVRQSGVAGVPVVGVCAWEGVKGHDQLQLADVQGETVTYDVGGAARTQYEARRKAAGAVASTKPRGAHLELNADHTHFIFVDGPGAEGGPTTDTPLRARIVDAYTDRRHLPVVMLVVGGDASTLSCVLAAARGSTPIVCVRGSGGAADAIVQSVLQPEAAEEEDVAASVDAAFQTPSARKILDELYELHAQQEGNLLTCFDLFTSEDEEDGGSSLSTVILDAIVRILCRGQPRVPRNKVTPATAKLLQTVHEPADEAHEDAAPDVESLVSALRLAVNWDRPAIAKKLLDKEVGSLASAPKRAIILSLALQRAVERRRTEIVKLLLEAGAPLTRLNVLPLFGQQDTYNFLNDLSLRTALGSRRADVAHRGVAAFLGKASPLLEALALEPRQAETGEGAPAVAPEKKGADAAEEEEGEEEAIKYDGARIAFFWAVIMGQDELARVLWQRCRDPLHMAVLGAYLCGYQSGQIAIGEEEVMERAKRLESWAHNAIDHAPNAEVARRVLSSPASSKHLGGLLELAVECEMKSLLSHRHCVSLMKDRWVGNWEGSLCKLRLDFSYTRLVLCTFVPILYPLLIEDRPGSASSKLKNSVGSGTAMLRNLSKKESKQMTLDFLSKAQQAAFELRGANSSRSRRRGGTAAASARVTVAPEIKAAEEEVFRIPGLASIQLDLMGVHKRLLKRGGIISRVAAFYSVPAVKYVTRAAVHLSLLVLHFLVLSLSFTAEELQRTLLTDPLPLVVESASGDMSSGSGAALAVGTTATVEWGGSILSTPAFPAVTTLSYPEILLFALCLTIFLDRCHVEMRAHQLQSVGAPAQGAFESRLWGVANLLYLSAFIVRVLSDLFNDGGQNVIIGLPRDKLLAARFYRIFQVILSLDTILLAACSMPVMSLWEGFGTLMIVLRLMVKDAFLWLVLMLVVNMGFAGTFLGLWRAGLYQQDDLPYGDDGAGSDWSSDGHMDWTYHARSHPIVAGIWGAFEPPDNERFSFYADGLTWVYALVMNAGLLNLLVAMFATTYEEVLSNASIEYNFLMFQRVDELHAVLLRTPPPFNLPIVVWELCAFGLKWLCRQRGHLSNLPLPRSMNNVGAMLPGGLSSGGSSGGGGPGGGASTELMSHRLVDLYLQAERQEQAGSVEGVLSAAHELILNERGDAASRNAKLTSMLSEVLGAMNRLEPQQRVWAAPAPAPAPTETSSEVEAAYLKRVEELESHIDKLTAENEELAKLNQEAATPQEAGSSSTRKSNEELEALAATLLAENEKLSSRCAELEERGAELERWVRAGGDTEDSSAPVASLELPPLRPPSATTPKSSQPTGGGGESPLRKKVLTSGKSPPGKNTIHL